MVHGLQAHQYPLKARLFTYTANKPLRGRSECASRRRILLSRRSKHDTLVVASSTHTQAEVSGSELQRRLNKAVGLINTADLLAPFDRSTYSSPLVIW